MEAKRKIGRPKKTFDELPEIWVNPASKLAHVFDENSDMFSVCGDVTPDEACRFYETPEEVTAGGCHWCKACEFIYSEMVAEGSRVAPELDVYVSRHEDEIMTADGMVPLCGFADGHRVRMRNGAMYNIPKKFLPIILLNGGVLCE